MISEEAAELAQEFLDRQARIEGAQVELESMATTQQRLVDKQRIERQRLVEMLEMRGFPVVFAHSNSTESGAAKEGSGKNRFPLSLSPLLSRFCSWVSGSIASSFRKTKRGHDTEEESDCGEKSRPTKRRRQGTGGIEQGEPFRECNPSLGLRA